MNAAPSSLVVEVYAPEQAVNRNHTQRTKPRHGLV